jgi:hypothetical protein
VARIDRKAAARTGSGRKRMPYREAKPKGPPPPPTTTGAPPFWYWLALQRARDDRDTALAEAAIYIADRWPLGPDYLHSRVLRTLHREQSPHYDAACRLADEWCLFSGLTLEDHLSVRNSVHPLRPNAPESCEHAYQDGRVCGSTAVPFTARCARHGGQWVDPEDYQYISRTVRDRVVQLSGQAVAQVEALMLGARSEKIRLEAAQTVLRMTGMDPANGGAQVTINVPTVEKAPEDPFQVVWDRLEAISSHAEQVLSGGAGEVIDAEVVEEE